MRKIPLLIFMAFGVALLCAPIEARIIRVPGDRDDIRSGLQAANNRDTVLVANGTYTGNNNTGIDIGNKVLMSSGGPDSCFIDLERAANRSAFTLSSGSVLQGFSIINASFTALSAANAQNFTVRTCTISDGENFERIGVGLLADQNSTGLIEQSIFRNNGSGENGAAIRVLNGANIRIWNSIFIDNESDRFGGGIYVSLNGRAAIGNCIFRNNVARADGAGIAISQSAQIVVRNSNFSGQNSNGDGGGIYCGSNSTAEVRDCIFWQNQASRGHNLFEQDDNGGRITISNCIVQGGVEEEGRWDGEDIIDDAPMWIRGRQPIWGLDDVYLNPDSPAIDAGSADAADVGMDTLSTQVDMTLDEDAVDIGFHYDPNNFNRVGELYGYVYDAETRRGISDVLVYTTLGQWATTTRIGFWIIPDALTGTFDITATARGFNDSTLTDFELEEGDTVEVIFSLLHPEFIPSTQQIRANVVEDSTTEVAFNFRNTGNGPLEWTVEPRLVGGANVDPWAERNVFFVGNAVDDSRIQGVAYVDSLYYVAGGNGNEPALIYVFSRAGALIDSFYQASDESNGLKDLTWDGEMLWGANGDSLYGFTTDGEFLAVIESPIHPTGPVTWDPDREVLWVCNTTTDIVAVDREGNPIQDLRLNRRGLRMYGLAYWADDPDGYPLYVLINNSVLSTRQVYKFNPDTNDTLLAATIETEAGESPLGAFITGDIDPFSIVFMSIINQAPNAGGDRVEVLQLSANTAWMQLDQRQGVLQAEEQQDLTLTLHALEFPLGIYQGQLIFKHNAGGGQDIVRIFMTVVEWSSVFDIPTPLPSSFAINTVHPNPFNQRTQVNYSLSTPGDAELAVFDLVGRQMAVLLSGYHAAGRHSVSMDAESLPTGMYLLRLESGGAVKTAKLVCIK